MRPRPSLPTPPFAADLLTTGRGALLLLAVVCVTAPSVFAEVTPTGLWITGNNYARAVSGSVHEVGFTLSNFDNDTISFTLGATGNTTAPVGFGGVTSPITGGVLGTPTQQPYSFLADTSGAAGTSISVGMTATEVLPGMRTASSSFNLRLLENRTVGFSLAAAGVGGAVSSEGVLDLGRYIGNQTYSSLNAATNTFVPSYTWTNSRELNLTFNGGTQGRDLATDVRWNPALLDGANAYRVSFQDTNNQSVGLTYWKGYPQVLNSATKDFNAANQTQTVALLFSETGTFSKTVDFSSAAHLGKGFSPESVSGSTISGAEVKFQGSQITIQGSSLSNRTIVATDDTGNGITSNGVNVYDYRSSRTGGFDTDTVTPGIQNRVMVGSSGNIAAGAATWTLSSPGLDGSTTRVNFTGSGVKTSGNGIVSVDTGIAGSVTSFDGTSNRAVTASWTGISFGTQAGATFNTTAPGPKSSTVSLTSNLSSGETTGMLPGQNLGSLSVGYSLDVVANRPVFAPNVSQTAFAGYNFNTLSNVISGEPTGSYTNPTVTTQSGVSQVLSNYGGAGQYYMYDNFSTGLGTTGGGSGTRTFTVSPEGLAGERAEYQMSYNWALNRVNQAQMSTAGTLAGSLDHQFARGITEVGNQVMGTFSLFQNNAGPGVADARIDDYSLASSSKGWSYSSSSSNLGRAETFSFSFDDTGLKNGTYFTSVTITAQHANQSIIGSGYNDLGVYNHLLEVVVSGREDNTGYKGFRLTQWDVASSQVSEGGVSMEILDIIEPSGERGVSMEILSENGSVTGPNGQTVGFASGEVSGLEGLKFVLQSSYDQAELISTFGTESVAVLLWKNEAGEFVNAVLGNTGNAENGALADRLKVGQRFVGSYENYLLGLGVAAVPRLGDFGYDPANDKVWAVLDHNSTFGGAGAVANGVPEPSTFVILLMGATLTFRRRRSS